MRIGVLTSGGDAPGMNACIRAVVRRAIERGSEVVGIERGYAGLLQGNFRPLDRRSVVNVIHRGGTILGTARSERFKVPEGRAEARETIRADRIEGVVLIGGDGTFRGAELWEAEGGPPTVGVPGTIDNDVGGTDRSIGSDTAVNTALEAIDRIRDTAASHELLHFVEVMGRHCGWLALAAGAAGGAEVVLIPETEIDLDALVAGIGTALEAGKRWVIAVVSEGVQGGAQEVATQVGRGL
jgi:6-phosphofructokinase 1